VVNEDRVRQSVAVYSSGAQAYALDHASKMGDRVERFTGLLPPVAQILDAGCGPGRDLQRFVAAGHQPVGIDLNPDFVAMASEFAPVIEGDLRNLAHYFSEARFDAVWASASLVHLDESETLRVLKTFRTLLRNRGKLYACVMSEGQTGWLKETDGLRWYRAWPPHEFVAIVEDAGFVVDDVTDGPYVEVWASRLELPEA
jgi:SAM-dependent methyltransferase